MGPWSVKKWWFEKKNSIPNLETTNRMKPFCHKGTEKRGGPDTEKKEKVGHNAGDFLPTSSNTSAWSHRSQVAEMDAE